jgi:archaellum component FlaC
LKKVLEILDIEATQLKELDDPIESIKKSLERIANSLEKIEKKL